MLDVVRSKEFSGQVQSQDAWLHVAEDIMFFAISCMVFLSTCSMCLCMVAVSGHVSCVVLLALGKEDSSQSGNMVWKGDGHLK